MCWFFEYACGAVPLPSAFFVNFYYENEGNKAKMKIMLCQCAWHLEALKELKMRIHTPSKNCRKFHLYLNAVRAAACSHGSWAPPCECIGKALYTIAENELFSSLLLPYILLHFRTYYIPQMTAATFYYPERERAFKVDSIECR